MSAIEKMRIKRIRETTPSQYTGRDDEESANRYKVFQENTKRLMMRDKAQAPKGSHKTLSIHIQLRGLMMSKL